MSKNLPDTERKPSNPREPNQSPGQRSEIESPELLERVSRIEELLRRSGLPQNLIARPTDS